MFVLSWERYFVLYFAYVTVNPTCIRFMSVLLIVLAYSVVFYASFVFVLCLVPYVACVSWLLILHCTFDLLLYSYRLCKFILIKSRKQNIDQNIFLKINMYVDYDFCSFPDFIALSTDIIVIMLLYIDRYIYLTNNWGSYFYMLLDWSAFAVYFFLFWWIYFMIENVCEDTTVDR
jgi:hypothetical protein